MNIPGKNGVHSMEDILADIRRKAAGTAGRTASGGLALVAIDDDAVSIGDEVVAGEGDDLPSILRASELHPATMARLEAQPARPTPGMRLVEALRRTEAGRFGSGEPMTAANDAQHDDAAATAAAQDEASMPPGEGHDSADPAFRSDAASGASAAAAETAPVRRVMVSFLDTRMSRMSAPSAPAPSSAPGWLAEQNRFADERFPTLAEIDAAAIAEPAVPIATVAPSATLHRVATVSETVVGDALAPVEALRDDVSLSQHAALEAPAADTDAAGVDEPRSAAVEQRGNRATGAAETGAAELLRPMLRQWLTDNMPRIVEKALHMELADSLASGKRNS
jgi:cell pole-organizing protein PopZ